MKQFIILNFIIPSVMILVGNILKKHPVIDMSKHQGYNTPSSRKSQDHWNYAQSIAPDIFLKYGKVSFVFIIVANLFFLFMNITIDCSLYLGIGLGLIFVLVSFFNIEKKIKIKFPN